MRNLRENKGLNRLILSPELLQNPTCVFRKFIAGRFPCLLRTVNSDNVTKIGRRNEPAKNEKS